VANNGADASPLRTLSRSRRANQRRGVHDTVQPTTWRGCSGVSARVVSPATAAATQRFRHAMPAVRYHTTPHPAACIPYAPTTKMDERMLYFSTNSAPRDDAASAMLG
jgi:hypothetical protein